MKTALNILMISLILSSLQWAQVEKKHSQTETVNQYAIGSGGIINGGNSSITISATTGQTAIDVIENSSYRLLSGFWIPRSVEVTLTKLTAQPAGSAQSAYRLLSVPIDLNNPIPDSVLLDDLGNYNKKEWRFFDYQNGSYKEFPNTRDFQPGRSYFLIVRDGGTIDAGPGELMVDSLVTVSLDAGYNFIANPFTFDISISALSHNQGGVSTYTSNGWSEPVSVLKPWEGYCIFVDSATTLTISSSTNETQLQPKIVNTNENGWSIQIKAQCQEAQDLANYAGVRSDASEKWDRYDFYKPPPIGEYVRLYFPHREWDVHPNIYGGDFRSENNQGYIWDFEVRSNITDVVKLTFAGLDEAPTNLQVWVVDQILKRAQNLHKNNQYYFENFIKGQVHQMILLVGEERFVQEKLLEVNVIPTQYALFQNFPNPFNLTTAIRFAVPQPQRVTLKIFDILGREVIKILDNELMDTGYHIEYWDGRNKHREAVASGIYLYHLQAGSFSKIKKMILAK